MAAKDWPHPISPADGYELLRSYLDRHSRQTVLVAALLGVHVRTIERWIAARRVPQHTAALLEQALNGPVYQLALWRCVARPRPPWTDYMSRWERETLRKLSG